MTMGETTSRNLRTVAQAMAQLSCSRSMIYKLVNNGKLKMVRFGVLGTHSRITEQSISQLLDEMMAGEPVIKSPPTQPHHDDDEDQQ